METKLLHEFLVLSKELNFSRAAERLNMTQPVLSRHIKYLEEHFESQFLKRNTHKVELTDIGKLFAEESQKILSQYETSVAAIRAFNGKSLNNISVVFLGEAMKSFLSSFLIWFGARHGGISVECCDNELDDIPGALENRACDLAIIIRPSMGRVQDSLRHIPLFADPLCVATNKNHPLAQQSVVSIRDVGNWPLLSVDRNTRPLAWECNAAFLERYGIEINIAKTCANLQSCCFNLEFNDQAVVLIPKHRRYLLGDNAVLIDVAEEDCWFVVEIVWHPKNTNPCRDIFVQELMAFRSARPLAVPGKSEGASGADKSYGDLPALGGSDAAGADTTHR